MSRSKQDSTESWKVQRLSLFLGLQHSSKTVIHLTRTDSAGVCECVCLAVCMVCLTAKSKQSRKCGFKAVLEAKDLPLCLCFTTDLIIQG